MKNIKVLFILDFWKEMVRCNDFFKRESQHYILGNWRQYIEDKSAVMEYDMKYPRAWIRFMYLSYCDFLRKTK